MLVYQRVNDVNEQGGPDSFLAISIRFFTEGIDSVRIGFRFLLVRFEERFDSKRFESCEYGIRFLSDS